MDVERIGLAVLAELRADNVVAPAAIIGGIVLDAAQWRAEFLNSLCDVIAHPAYDRFRHFAAQRRRRPDCDAAAIPQYDGLKPHHILDGAFTCDVWVWHGGCYREFTRQSNPAG